MCVMVEVVVNLDVVVAQFHIVGENIVEGDDVAGMILLALHGVGRDTLFRDDRQRHIARIVVVGTAART